MGTHLSKDLQEKQCVLDIAHNQNCGALCSQKSDYSQSINSSVDRILFLQRTIGNQAVGRLIKSGALQAKLSIGAPGDVYEQEAYQSWPGVADAVMRMSQAVSSGTPSIQRACPKCEDDELKRQPIKEEDEEKKMQRKQVEEGGMHLKLCKGFTPALYWVSPILSNSSFTCYFQRFFEYHAKGLFDHQVYPAIMLRVQVVT